MEQTLDFMKNSTLWEKINFYFSVTFESIDKFTFWEKDWALGYNFMKT